MSNLSERKDTDRRGFLRKLVVLTGSAGVAGVLLDRLIGKSALAPVQADGGTSGGALIIDASGPGSSSNNGTGTTQLNSSGSPALIAANTGSGAGLQGSCTAGTGVLGTTANGTGVQGTASASTGVAVGGFAGDPGAIPIVAQGTSSQTANLQEWRGSSGSALSVVNASGRFGVGTASPAYALSIYATSTTGFIYETDGAGVASLTSNSYANATTAGGGFIGAFARGSKGSPAAVQVGDRLGFNVFGGYTGSGFANVAAINAIVDSGTVSSSSLPSAIQFLTTSNGSVSRSERMRITAAGNVGIGTTAPDMALSVSGNADKSSGGTSWGTFCDRRWKDEASIEPFTLGLDWVRSLPTPVTFHYAKDNGIGADPEPENVNFIAQDLLDGVHDMLVYETRNKVKESDRQVTTTYGVNVNNMHFAMVNAIKELAEQNTALREEVLALRSRIENFEQTVKIAAG